jgi:DNA-binding NarL/FixJ family response regulator
MRQAIAGLDLHLTTRDAADLVIAAGASRLVPKSWVATEVRRREGASDDPVSQLSAAKLRVLDQVKLAKTNRQIGKALGLSHHTVNNQRKIYAAFGVGSRAAVAVRCAEQKRVR